MDWVATILLIMAVLTCAPIITIYLEFGKRNGLRLARLYSHFFIWPILFGITAIIYSYGPIHFIISYFRFIGEPGLRLALLAGVPAALAAFVVVMDQLGSTAIWELKPKAYRLKTPDICHPDRDELSHAEHLLSPRHVVNRIFLFEDLERKKDGVEQQNKALPSGQESGRRVFNIFKGRATSISDELECRKKLSDYLGTAKLTYGPSITRSVFVPSMFCLTFGIFYGLCILCVFGLEGEALHQWSPKQFGAQVSNLFVVLFMVGLWVLKRWYFQQETSAILNTSVSTGYAAIRNAYTFVLAAYMFASGLLILALKSESEATIGNIVLPMVGAGISAMALLRPKLVEGFMRLFFGVGSNLGTYLICCVAQVMIWLLPLLMHGLAEREGTISAWADFFHGHTTISVWLCEWAMSVALWLVPVLTLATLMIRFKSNGTGLAYLYSHFFLYPVVGGLVYIAALTFALMNWLPKSGLPPELVGGLAALAGFSSLLLLSAELSGDPAPWETKVESYLRPRDELGGRRLSDVTSDALKKGYRPNPLVRNVYLTFVRKVCVQEGTDRFITFFYVGSFLVQTFVAIVGVETVATITTLGLGSPSNLQTWLTLIALMVAAISFLGWLLLRLRFQQLSSKIFLLDPTSQYAVLRKGLGVGIIVWFICVADISFLAVNFRWKSLDRTLVEIIFGLVVLASSCVFPSVRNEVSRALKASSGRTPYIIGAVVLMSLFLAPLIASRIIF